MRRQGRVQRLLRDPREVLAAGSNPGSVGGESDFCCLSRTKRTDCGARSGWTVPQQGYARHHDHEEGKLCWMINRRTRYCRSQGTGHSRQFPLGDTFLEGAHSTYQTSQKHVARETVPTSGDMARGIERSNTRDQCFERRGDKASHGASDGNAQMGTEGQRRIKHLPQRRAGVACLRCTARA